MANQYQSNLPDFCNIPPHPLFLLTLLSWLSKIELDVEAKSSTIKLKDVVSSDGATSSTVLLIAVVLVAFPWLRLGEKKGRKEGRKRKRNGLGREGARGSEEVRWKREATFNSSLMTQQRLFFESFGWENPICCSIRAFKSISFRSTHFI